MFDVAFVLVADADASVDAEASDLVATSFGAFGIVQPVPPSPPPTPSDHPRQTQLRRDGQSQRPHSWLAGHVHFFRSGTLLLAGVGSFVSTTFGFNLTSVFANFLNFSATIYLIFGFNREPKSAIADAEHRLTLFVVGRAQRQRHLPFTSAQFGL
jgi:hypothetical protein